MNKIKSVTNGTAPVQDEPKDKKKDKKKKGKNLDDLKSEMKIDDHKISLAELSQRYGTNLDTGLTEEQAKAFLKKYGPNALTPPKQTPEIVKFIRQMTTGFSILLWLGSFFSLIAFGVQYASDNTTPFDNVWLGVALALVVVITGCFQYYQGMFVYENSLVFVFYCICFNNKKESKSSKIMESFKKMIPQEASVNRDGKTYNVPASQLVIGDIVNVKIGDKVPADIRIVNICIFKFDTTQNREV